MKRGSRHASAARRGAARSAARRASSAGPVPGAARIASDRPTAGRPAGAVRGPKTRPEGRHRPSAQRAAGPAPPTSGQGRRNGTQRRDRRQKSSRPNRPAGRSNFEWLTSWFDSRDRRFPNHCRRKCYPARSRNSRPGRLRHCTHTTAEANRRLRPPGSARRSTAIARFAAQRSSSTQRFRWSPQGAYPVNDTQLRIMQARAACDERQGRSRPASSISIRCGLLG